MKVQSMICVTDVVASSAWYQAALGLSSAHGGDEYEQLADASGRVLLQLHHWEAHEHSLLGDAGQPCGNGVVLWFETDDFEASMTLVAASGALVIDGPMVNPLAAHHEVWLRDPDGYVVVIASTYGTA